MPLRPSRTSSGLRAIIRRTERRTRCERISPPGTRTWAGGDSRLPHVPLRSGALRTGVLQVPAGVILERDEAAAVVGDLQRTPRRHLTAEVLEPGDVVGQGPLARGLAEVEPRIELRPRR